jgi:hypothetical protein
LFYLLLGILNISKIKLMNHRIKLLHSCWCIAFGCWNSDSEFEFKCLSFFQIVQIFFLPTHIPFSFSAHHSNQPAAASRPRPASPHRGPALRLAQPAQQAAAASPLRLLPRLQSMTPSPRRIPLGLPGRVRPAAARAPSVLGPHAKAVTRPL